MAIASARLRWPATTPTNSSNDNPVPEPATWYGKSSTGGGGNALDAARLKKMAAQLADFVQSPQTRLLDMGCATGGLLHELQLLGYQNGVGFDPSPACVHL